MSIFLKLAFLFFVGSIAGWVLELLYRNRKAGCTKWINPGFCTGPYVPLYGFGLCILYLLASLEQKYYISNRFLNKLVSIVLMALAMTAIEYIAGIICLKIWKVRLWDYSDMKGNIQGIICPAFSLAWAGIAVLYDIFVHPYILEALQWLSNNLAFSFIIGVFFGIFIIDFSQSAQLVVKMKKFAEENQVIVKYEAIKQHIREKHREQALKYNFFFPFRSEHPISEAMREIKENLENAKINKKF